MIDIDLPGKEFLKKECIWSKCGEFEINCVVGETMMIPTCILLILFFPVQWLTVFHIYWIRSLRPAAFPKTAVVVKGM